MKKNNVVVLSSIIILLIVYILLDPVSWFYINKYGITFNTERLKVNHIPIKASYKANWSSKYSALEFLPLQFDNEVKNFKYKRMIFHYWDIVSEVDSYSKLSPDSAKLAILYKLYDFQKQQRTYTLEVFKRDSTDFYFFENRFNLNRQTADSVLTDWSHR